MLKGHSKSGNPCADGSICAASCGGKKMNVFGVELNWNNRRLSSVFFIITILVTNQKDHNCDVSQLALCKEKFLKKKQLVINNP